MTEAENIANTFSVKAGILDREGVIIHKYANSMAPAHLSFCLFIASELMSYQYPDAKECYRGHEKSL